MEYKDYVKATIELALEACMNNENKTFYRSWNAERIKSTMDQAFRKYGVRTNNIAPQTSVPISGLSNELAKAEWEIAFKQCLNEKSIHVLSPIQRLENEFNLLDLCFECSRRDLVDSSIPLTLLEELVETVPAQHLSSYLDYLETRIDPITLGLQPSKGKGLVLLRLCNDLVRRLSKPRQSSQCGRISLFLAHAFPLTDRSAVNLRGAFNVENGIQMDSGGDDLEHVRAGKRSHSVSDLEEGETIDPGDVKAKTDTPSVTMDHVNRISFPHGTNKRTRTDQTIVFPSKERGAPGVPDLQSKESSHIQSMATLNTAEDPYDFVWSLQPYFSNPPSSFKTSATWARFVTTTDQVLTLFEQLLSKGNLSITRVEMLPFPKYLANRRLFPMQIRNKRFVQQILTQLLIFFHYLENNTPSSSLLVRTNFSSLDPMSASASISTPIVQNATSPLEKPLVVSVPSDTSTCIFKASGYAFSLTNEQKACASSLLERTVCLLCRLEESFSESEQINMNRLCGFSRLILSLLDQEWHWISWKRDGCPPLERTALPSTIFTTKRFRVRPRARETLPSSLTTELGQLWSRTGSGKQLLSRSAHFQPSTAKSFLNHFVEQLNVEQQIDPEYQSDHHEAYVWKAMRLVAHEHPEALQRVISASVSASPSPGPLSTSTPSVPCTLLIDLESLAMELNLLPTSTAASSIAFSPVNSMSSS